jgi:hypothetical protein
MVINPRRLIPPPEGTPEGHTVLTYEGDHTRGGAPGRLHRVVIKGDLNKVTSLPILA